MIVRLMSQAMVMGKIVGLKRKPLGRGRVRGRKEVLLKFGLEGISRIAGAGGMVSQKESGVRRGVKEKDLNRNNKNNFLGIGVFTDSKDTINDDTPVGVASSVQEGVTPSVVEMGMQNSMDDTTVPDFFHHYLRRLLLRLVMPLVAYSVVAIYVRNTWGKYGLVRSMFSSSTGLFSFQFSSMDGLDAMLENSPWSCYARVMIELHVDLELKDNIVVAMPKITRECHYTCASEKKTVKKPSQNSRGVSVGPKMGFKTHKEYRHVLKKPTASPSDNDVQFVITTPIIDKIRKFEDLLASGQAILVDRADNHLKKVEFLGEYDSEDGVASVDNDMARSMASERVGFGTQSLLEQWRDSYGNGDYDDDHDDDMYDGQDLFHELQAICDHLDIRVRESFTEISEDPKNGNDQARDTFWYKTLDVYNERAEENGWKVRNKNILTVCFSVICLISVNCSLFIMAIMIGSLDHGNPLYLHADDSNCVSIVSVKLTGVENYRIELVLRKLYKLSIKCGSNIDKPELAFEVCPILPEILSPLQVIKAGHPELLIRFLMNFMNSSYHSPRYAIYENGLPFLELTLKPQQQSILELDHESPRSDEREILGICKPFDSHSNHEMEGGQNLQMKTCFNSSHVFIISGDVLPSHCLATPVSVRGKIRSIRSSLEIPEAVIKLIPTPGIGANLPKLKLCYGETLSSMLRRNDDSDESSSLMMLVMAEESYKEIPPSTDKLLVYAFVSRQNDNNRNRNNNWSNNGNNVNRGSYDSLFPCNDEERPCGRDGNAHQPDLDSFLGLPKSDEQIPDSGLESNTHIHQPGHDDLSTITPIEAFKDRNWINVMNDKTHALYENDTWYLTDLPAGRKPIGSKWVFRIKYKSDGKIDRFKAKGFGQKEGINYEKTFSPVVKIGAVRCLLSLPVQNNWNIFQMDVNNAFLYGDLNEEEYMLPLPSFFNPSDKKVCRLKKSLYGLKQAPRQWNHKLSKALKENKLLHEFGLLACRSVLTHLPENIVRAHKESKNDKILHMHAPFKSHFDIALRLLKYLKLAPGNGIQFLKRQNGFNNTSFSDSDWAKCPITGRSISVYCVFVNGYLISWKSKNQATLSKSSVEAEYRSMASATCEVMWIVKIMRDLNVDNLLTAELYYDNKSAIQIAANPVMHERQSILI
nr:hypothetical protein [Tanacetum cinerariifolium]